MLTPLLSLLLGQSAPMSSTQTTGMLDRPADANTGRTLRTGGFLGSLPPGMLIMHLPYAPMADAKTATDQAGSTQGTQTIKGTPGGGAVAGSLPDLATAMRNLHLTAHSLGLFGAGGLY